MKTLGSKDRAKQIETHGKKHLPLPPAPLQSSAKCSVSNRPAKMLILVAPAGLEKMFLEVGVPLEEGAMTALPPSHEEIEKLPAVAPKYGVEIMLPGK